jgi:hypothetical protein
MLWRGGGLSGSCRGRYRSSDGVYWRKRPLLSGSCNISGMLRPLVWTPPTELLPLGVVVADAAFDSQHKYRHVVRERPAAASVIPVKRGSKATWQVQDQRAEMRAAFPRQMYRRRALVERVFSAAKRKLARQEYQVEAPKCSGHRYCCWGWLTTCTGADFARFEAHRTSLIERCQRSQVVCK